MKTQTRTLEDVDSMYETQLEREQVELLGGLVEASRSIRREERRFFHVKYIGGERVHGTDFSASVAPGDVESLQSAGLLKVLSYGSHGSMSFQVSPLGFDFYEQRMKEVGEPMAQVEDHARTYINGESFLTRHAASHRLWAGAAERVWGAESSEAQTAIGHSLREAMQTFASELVEHAGLTDANPDPTKTLDRVSAVVESHRERLGASASALLDAAFGYWRALNEIVQRQEHGTLEGLSWEDGRRAIFHTMFVMTELDRILAP